VIFLFVPLTRYYVQIVSIIAQKGTTKRLSGEELIIHINELAPLQEVAGDGKMGWATYKTV